MTVTGPSRRTRDRGTGRQSPPVSRRFLDDQPFVLCIEATLPGLDLVTWIEQRRAELSRDLLEAGAILFRGFAVVTATDFARVARANSPDLLDYLERAAPRQEVADKVFTSTEFSPDQWIPMHHEMSYSHNWPSLLYFFCEKAAATGGETPLASERRVYPQIPADLRDRFTAHGVRYVRNYSDTLDLPWQDVFQTSDKSVVEAYCRETATDFAWMGRDGLRTSAVRQAVVQHPKTGEMVWFNHSHLFHGSNMPADVRSSLLSEVGVQGLPRNAYFGDGSPIEDEAIAFIRALYQESSVTFDWRNGDVLVVDNFLATHGRAPFTGDRSTLVAMSDLYVNSTVIGSVQ
jgi:alpha-ketoglutarate-dependent taurine dioxygenase